jgi:hypothetical protein
VPRSNARDRTDLPDVLRRNCLGYGFETAVEWSLADGHSPYDRRAELYPHPWRIEYRLELRAPNGYAKFVTVKP